MNYILFDGTSRNNLLPFTFTRPVADIRVGILTIREKWEKMLGENTSTLTKSYLQEKYPLINKVNDVLINASYLPTQKLVEHVMALKENQAIYFKDEIVAVYTSENQEEVHPDKYEKIYYKKELLQIKNTWDIFSLNKQAIKADIQLITKGRKSAIIPKHVHATHPERIFIEESATLEFCTLNASDGPIYIGENAKILDGSMIRGTFSLCKNSVVKMGAKIYGGTTVGPSCTVGGEIKNVVFFGNANKGHDGYLGDSVIGEWCNLGADTNNSNLKNNYAEVRLWSYETQGFAHTGLQFCGLMMGDHSKSGINTMFNTGTVVGVSANIFGDGFPRNFIPSFSWGGAHGFSTFNMKKVKEVAKVVMARRGKEFDTVEESILDHIFELTKEFRH